MLTSATNINTTCRWCGSLHGVRCPSVKSIEYFEDGVTVRKVEYFSLSESVIPSGQYSNPVVTYTQRESPRFIGTT